MNLRETLHINITDRELFVKKALSWAMKQDIFSFLNGNGHDTLHQPFETMLAVGKADEICSSENSFDKLNGFIDQKKDWMFGYFTYDLKNEIENLKSEKPSTISFPHLSFFQPRTIIFFYDDSVTISSFEDPDQIYDSILEENTDHTSEIPNGPIKLIPHTSKKNYLKNVRTIKNQILEGEYYEMNYCIEFSAQNVCLDPLLCYRNLNHISPMPFSALIKTDNKFLICASPERFIKKEGTKVISQPIKGTIKRGLTEEEDEMLKLQLEKSEKERAENMMIVDLVRNDLARSAVAGTVKVEELFGIYSFKKVHQMISTVTAEIKPAISNTEVIKNAFPMGSMTGAPKIRVMQEIEMLEDRKRGLYSGSIGYFSPDGDFDFNVVIRSIIYDDKNEKISFHVGSAITYDANAESEYKECLLKAEAIMEVLKNTPK